MDEIIGSVPEDGKRGTKGIANGRAKLTEEEVAWIKFRLNRGEPISAIAEDKKMSYAAIRAIDKGWRWKDVPAATSKQIEVL